MRACDHFSIVETTRFINNDIFNAFYSTHIQLIIFSFLIEI